MEIEKLELGNSLRHLRQQREETLHQVAVGTDIDSPLLSKIERGERLPTLKQLAKLSAYYGISEEEMKVKYTAQKILKDYGLNQTTYNAILLVNEQLTPYIITSEKK